MGKFTRETWIFFLEVKMVIFQINMVIFLLKLRKLGIFGNLGEPNFGIENWETTWWENFSPRFTFDFTVKDGDFFLGSSWG
jgi:hypothetical protein